MPLLRNKGVEVAEDFLIFVGGGAAPLGACSPSVSVGTGVIGFIATVQGRTEGSFLNSH